MATLDANAHPNIENFRQKRMSARLPLSLCYGLRYLGVEQVLRKPFMFQVVKSPENKGFTLPSERASGLVRSPEQFFERQEIHFISTFYTAFLAQQSELSAHRDCPKKREAVRLR